MKASLISTWIFLLATAAYIQKVNGESDWTPLMKAVKKNDMDMVKNLLDSGADAKATDHYEWSALMMAAYYRNDKMVKLLLPMSDAKATNRFGYTALMYAVMSGNDKSVELLLPKSDVAATNKWGYTALDYAKHENYEHNQIVSLLRQQGYIL